MRLNPASATPRPRRVSGCEMADHSPFLRRWSGLLLALTLVLGGLQSAVAAATAEGYDVSAHIYDYEPHATELSDAVGTPNQKLANVSTTASADRGFKVEGSEPASWAGLRHSPVFVAPTSLVDDAVGTVSPSLEVGGTRYIYGDSVLNRAIQEPGPFHNFPNTFDADVLTTGTRTVVSDRYIEYSLPGVVHTGWRVSSRSGRNRRCLVAAS